MRKKIILLFIVLILSYIFVSCSKKKPKPIVAKVGNTKISINEFHDRFEFTPQIMLSKNKQQNKRNFLNSLLGEKIFAEEGYQRNLHKSEKFQTYAKQMEKEAVIETLFEREITSKIKVTAAELKQAYIKSKQELELQVLNFDNENDVLKAKAMIAAGKSFHDVKRILQTQDFISVDSVLTLPLRWGEAHPDIEEAAYRLKLNEVSDPILIEGNYFILKLINKKKQLLLTEADFYQQIPSLKKTIRQRKSAEMFDDFLHAIMRGKKLYVSHKVFNFIANELERFYPIKDNQSESNKLPPQNKGMETFLASGTLADHLTDTFARFEDGTTWTIGDFIKNLSVGPYPLDYKSKKRFRKSLRRIIRRMAEFESLAKKGYQLNLHKTPYVKYQTQMWNDAYIAREIRKSIIDTIKVSGAEIEYYYKTHPQNYIRPEMLKLQEILVDDIQLAKQLYQRIQQGEDMAKLAREYSKRELSKKKGGISGFFTTQTWGEIGKVASKLKKGKLGGPVKTDKNQYSIFKLIDKKPAGVMPLNEVYNEVKLQALNDKQIRTLDNYLIKFSAKYDINVYPAVYDTIKTYDLNMLVFKRHFPSRLAAPPVTPLFKSFRWQNKMDTVFRKKGN